MGAPDTLFKSLLYWGKPQSVFIEPTNCCNLQCVICPHSYKELSFEKGHMEWDFFQKVIAQVKGVGNISLFSTGEPLAAKNWDRILNHCLHELPSNKSLSFSTNGILLTENRILPLLGRDISITISIDGTTKTVYEKIRTGARYDVLIRNLTLLASLKRRHATDKPTVNIAFVAWKENIAELPGIIHLASQFGCELVYVIHRIFYREEEFLKNSLCHHRELFDTCLSEAIRTARQRNIKMLHTGDFSGHIPPSEGLKDMYFQERGSGVLSCRVIDEQANIGYNGAVRACCYIDKLFMGNMHHNSFNEIWNGPLYRRFRLNMYRGKKPRGCDTCSFLQILKMEEKACFSPLNTGGVILASPPIIQPYSIDALNAEFQHITSQWESKRSDTDSAIRELLVLWQRDSNLFEVANNLALMFHAKGDRTHALFWIRKARELIQGDPLIERNLARLSA